MRSKTSTKWTMTVYLSLRALEWDAPTKKMPERVRRQVVATKSNSTHFGVNLFSGEI